MKVLLCLAMGFGPFLLRAGPAAGQASHKAPPAPESALEPTSLPKSEPTGPLVPVPEGPPTAALARNDPPEDSNAEKGSGGYVDKEKSPYLDIVVAGNWESKNWLANICIGNMYLHDEGDTWGFHGRFLALGVLSFEQRVVTASGSFVQRVTTFPTVDVMDLGPRIYFVKPVFLALGANIGVSFYDGPVPFLDFNGGLGFEYGGWGLESGVRSSRLPREAHVIDGQEFVDIKYGVQLYVALETNIPL